MNLTALMVNTGPETQLNTLTGTSVSDTEADGGFNQLLGGLLAQAKGDKSIAGNASMASLIADIQQQIEANPALADKFAALLHNDKTTPEQLNALLASLGLQGAANQEQGQHVTLLQPEAEDKSSGQTHEEASMATLFAMLSLPVNTGVATSANDASLVGGNFSAQSGIKDSERATGSARERLFTALQASAEKGTHYDRDATQDNSNVLIDNSTLNSKKLLSRDEGYLGRSLGNAANSAAPSGITTDSRSFKAVQAEQVLTQNAVSGSANTASALAVATTPASAALHTLASSAATVPTLHAPLGSSEWQQALNQQILMFSRNGQQTAELRLNPQELGSLHISLKLDDNMAQLHIAAAQGAVRSAVEAALPQLRHALAESGIQLTQSSVSSDGQNAGQQASQQQQQEQLAQQRNGNQPSEYQRNFGQDTDESGRLSVPESLQRLSRSGQDGVDIFA